MPAQNREQEALEILGRLEALLATRNAQAAAAARTASPPVHVPHWQDVLRAVLPFWLSIATAVATLVMFQLVARPYALTASIITGATLAVVHRGTDAHHRALVLGALCGVGLGLGVALIS